jgi:hypothetical protein
MSNRLESSIYPAVSSPDFQRGIGLRRHLRRSIGIEEDVSVLEFLGIRAMLKVLLKRVLANMSRPDWTDGGLVDNLVSGCLVCHYDWSLRYLGD